MPFKFFTRRTAARPPMDELYRSVVAVARDPRWYATGAVPDTLDGRFDMVVLVLSLVMVRMERESASHSLVGLTERFVEDMDGSLREIGIGDLVVGKHVGRMVGALEGRLGAYRAAIAGSEPLREALIRNLYRGEAPLDETLAWMETEVAALASRVDAMPLDRLLAGEITP